MYEVVDHRHLDGTSAIYLPGVAVGDRSLKSAKPYHQLRIYSKLWLGHIGRV